VKIAVTDQGVVIPKEWFPGVNEVDVKRKEGGVIILQPDTAIDPIVGLGEHPVECGIADGSENHNHYLYGVTL